ncbi:uncharacterized protein EDB91DRAFT_1130980 [Suillus paluster]|uniref:uncharacterized protein n=1 Tax=Suillus paluster TaxID=48578 RepID=UPI001B87F53A|nr:uncharacterized protein EDB91DRAFT_1130980 [Suillus paluster]KAG1741533.1 hypothetical protein EDB91DRAFT_1130980 [Suillus paluster]
MINQSLIDEPVFSFRLGGSEADGGEVTFGGIDHEAYTGNISYVPVSRKAYWEVKLEKVDDKRVYIPLGTALRTYVQGPLSDFINLIQSGLEVEEQHTLPSLIVISLWVQVGSAANLSRGKISAHHPVTVVSTRLGNDRKGLGRNYDMVLYVL